MGDPALRLHAVEPPRHLRAASADSQITLAWNASSEPALLGYHVYRAPTPAGPFTRLTEEPLTATTYIDSTVTAGQTYAYLARTLKLEAAPGGSYYNLSVGSALTLTARRFQRGPLQPHRPDRHAGQRRTDDAHVDRHLRDRNRFPR
jgi:hypothetical protein